MRYNRALGADIMLGYVVSSGTRFLNDASRAVVLDALASMSPTMAMAGQAPAIDAYGARIIFSPGLIPIPGVPNARDTLLAAAAAGQTVLVSENFQEGNDQVIRLVTNPALLPALTDPALGGSMAVLLLPAGTPLTLPSVPGLPPLSTPSPSTPTVPGAPAGAQVSPAPPTVAPAAATIFGMQRSTAIAVGAAAAIGLVAVIALSSKSKGGR
jgi:hypothetical protein